MRTSEIAEDVQDQLASVVHIARENVVGALEFLTEQGQRLIPSAAARLTERLPKPAQVIDRGFARTEAFLRPSRG